MNTPSAPTFPTANDAEGVTAKVRATLNRALRDEPWAMVAEVAFGGNEIRRMLIGRELIGAA